MATNTYFTEYEDLEIHELMLKDRPRQAAYYEAILGNKDLFKDKIVMDVGAGTGILSAFCAKAGARLVYAVEASNVATKVALELIQDNGLTDVVKVIHARVEEFSLPATAEKVDIIVSEWMGFYLLHEGMLDSVLLARDRFLKEGGLLFPSECTIYVAPCSVPSLYDDWLNVDGIKMDTFARKLRAQKSSKPAVLPVDPKDLLHEGVVLHWMNLLDVDVRELDCIEFKEVLAVQKAGNHQGFCIWFDVRFPGDNSVVLSTSPEAPLTHWKQVVVVLPEEICDDLEEREPVAFKICMKRRGDDARKYDLEVDQLDPQTEEHPVPCPCHMTKCILTEAHLKMMDTS